MRRPVAQYHLACNLTTAKALLRVSFNRSSGIDIFDIPEHNLQILGQAVAFPSNPCHSTGRDIHTRKTSRHIMYGVWFIGELLLVGSRFQALLNHLVLLLDFLVARKSNLRKLEAHMLPTVLTMQSRFDKLVHTLGQLSHVLHDDTGGQHVLLHTGQDLGYSRASRAHMICGGARFAMS